MHWGIRPFAINQVGKLGYGSGRGAYHGIIVVRARDGEELFRFIRFPKEFLSMPERDYGIRGTVHNEHGTMHVADIPGIWEFVKEEQWYPGKDSKGGNECALQDQSRRWPARRQMHGRPSANRSPIYKDAIGRRGQIDCEIVVGSKFIVIKCAF